MSRVRKASRTKKRHHATRQKPAKRTKVVKKSLIKKQKVKEQKIRASPSEKAKKEQNQSEVLRSEKLINYLEPAEIVDDCTSVREVLKLLEKTNCLLVSKKFAIIGVITPLSILKKVCDTDIQKMTADQLKEPIYSINADKTLLDCLTEMKSRNTGILVVENKYGGIRIVTSEKIIDFLRKRLLRESTEQAEIIETKIDEFLCLIRKGPISVNDVKKKLGVGPEQIEEWIQVLENQNIVKIERHFGRLKIKDERKV